MSTWLASATLGQAIWGGRQVKGMPGSAPSGPLREDRVCSQEQRRRRELTSAVREGAGSLNPPPTLKGPRTSCVACRLTLRKLSPSPLNSHPVCELNLPSVPPARSLLPLSALGGSQPTSHPLDCTHPLSTINLPHNLWEPSKLINAIVTEPSQCNYCVIGL